MQHLSFLRAAAAHVRRLAPLALLRGAEARAPSLPRIGEAQLPADNVVDLAQTPSLAAFVQAACANELGLGNPSSAQPRIAPTSASRGVVATFSAMQRAASTAWR